MIFHLIGFTIIRVVFVGFENIIIWDSIYICSETHAARNLIESHWTFTKT